MSRRQQKELIKSLAMEVRKFIAGTILFNEKVAKELGLNGTDLQCLNLLDLKGSLRPGELAQWCALTTGGVTVILDRLEKAGYIRREPNPKDRRSLLIRPVPARARRLRKTFQSKSDTLLKVLSEYDETGLQTVLGFFEKTNLGSAEWGARKEETGEVESFQRVP